MKKDQNFKEIKGTEVLTRLNQIDEKNKTFKSTIADVPEGLLKFDEHPKLFEVEYIKRNTNIKSTYFAIEFKASDGKLYVGALSAFREKDDLHVDGNTIKCENLCAFDAGCADTYNAIIAHKDEITLHRVVGRRNGFKGRFEYFTIG